MAYDETLALRIRQILADKGVDFTEKKCLAEFVLW